MNHPKRSDALDRSDPALAGVESGISPRMGDHHAFMKVLGLLPPFTIDDVHKAYKAQALVAHPDRGGSRDAFLKLQEAYEQAQEHLRFSDGRREWLANQVEPYLRQQEVIHEVERRAGKVVVEKLDWMKRSFGDFATLTERLREIDLRDAPDADDFLKFLLDQSKYLKYLVELNLAGSKISDAGLAQVARLRSLRSLNLARTPITRAGLDVIDELPELEWLNIGGTRIGWLERWRLKRLYPDIEIVARNH
jgi:hypothetical protein